MSEPRLRRSGAVLLLGLLFGLGVLAVAVRVTMSRTPAVPPLLPMPALGTPPLGVSQVDPLGLGDSASGPRPVYVGVYAIHVPHLDMMSNSYLIDFWIWFRWKGEDLNPVRSFQFMNQFQGWDTLQQPVYVDADGREKADPVGDGWFYQCLHVQTRFSRPFDLRRYPFDEQQLVVAIEDLDSTTDQMIYVPDAGSTAVDAGLDIPGWHLKKVTAEVAEAVYPTNFGDPRRPVGEDRYTRFAYTLHISRPVLGYLTTTLVPITIVMLITFCAFLVPLAHFEGRLSLAITSLISAVALHLTVSADLPKTGFVVLLDHVYNVAYLLILGATAESVFALRLSVLGQEGAAKTLDRWALGLFALTYFGSVALLIASAV